MRINVADRISLGQQPVSRVYLGPSLIWTADPALDLVFDGRALDPRMSFSRPSTATLFNSSGVLLSAAIDQPRYDHDPVTLALRGLLVEEQRTNVYTNSSQAPSHSTVTRQIDVEAAPDGSMTADRITPTATRDVHFSEYVHGSSVPTAFSIFIKPNGYGIATMEIGNYPFNSVFFNTATGVITNSSPALYSPVMRSISGGYFRISASSNNPSQWWPFARFGMAIENNNAYFLGDGVSGMYMWGVQQEAGVNATSYIPTTGTARTRAADTAALNPQGWLSAEKGVFVLQHDVPAGRPLLGNGSAALLNSVGPGRTALRYDGSGAVVVHNGGSPQSVAFPTFAASLQLLGAGAARANAAVSRLTYYPRRLTVQELQGMTA